MSTRQRDASGRFVKSGGQSLGTATATVLMVADKFADGARIVQKTSADAGKSVDAMSGSFDRASKAAAAFDNSKLGKIQQQIKAVTDQLKMVGVVAAGITLFGVKAAQDVNRTRTSIELLTGSVQKADKVFADIRKLTDRFNIPFDDAIQGAQAFLPIAKTTGVAVDELVKSAIRFQAYNPRKSFDEIKFSINEALSGDFVSIKDALDLSRKQRDDLKKSLEENGPGALLEGLNQILVERGFDDKTLEKLGESGANAFAQIKSEIKETMAVAFTPLLKDVVLPTIKAFGNLLRTVRETNPDLLKFAGGITAIVAAGVPLLTFLSSAISAYKALKVASAAVNLGGVGAIAKGGIAVAGGVAAGAGIATGLANAGVRTGDLGRIAKGESAMDILGERLKQILVIVVDQLLEFGRTIAKVVVYIRNAIEQFIRVFQVGGTLISEIFGNLRLTFARFIQALGDFIATLPGQGNEGLKIKGAGLTEEGFASGQIIAARQEREALQKELLRGFSPKQEDLDAVDANINAMKDVVVGGMIKMLFPVEEAVQETASSVEDSATTIKKAMGDSEEYLAQQAQDIAETTKKYNEEVTAAEAKKQQDIIELNEKFAQEQIQIAQDRVKAETKALNDLNNELRKMDTDLTRETEKEGRERGRKNIELEIEYQRNELKDAEAHRDKLLSIEADYRKKQASALENFDFAALFDLSEQVVEQTNEANEEYDKQRQERVQALRYERDDLVREFGTQREERLIQYEQDRADRLAAYELERSNIVNEAAEKLALAQQAHTSDMAQLINKYTAEQSLRQQAAQTELQLLMQTEQQRIQIMGQAQEALLQQAYSLMNRVRPGSITNTSGTTRSGGMSNDAIAAYNASLQGTRDYHTAAEKAGRTTYGVGGYESGRAYGGPVLAGRRYPVNELRNESFFRGSQTIPLPDGAGTFIPNQSGQIRPNASSGAPQLTVQVAINAPIDSGILTMDQAIAMIQRGAREGAEEVLSEFMNSFDR